MSYICQNKTCAIAIFKTKYPIPMNCTLCQQQLVDLKEVPLLFEKYEQFIALLPYAFLNKQYFFNFLILNLPHVPTLSTRKHSTAQ